MRGNAKLTLEDYDQIVEQSLGGMKTKELSEFWGIGVEQVRRILRGEVGVGRQRKSLTAIREITQEEVNESLERLTRGLEQRDNQQSEDMDEQLYELGRKLKGEEKASG